VKKSTILLLLILVFSGTSWAVKVDGKFWDWSAIGEYHKCSPRALSRDRSGFDMQSIKASLGAKFLYIYIEGRSVAGHKADRGWGVKKTSVRISFKSAQSPLNRVRIASDPARPGEIKISKPSLPTKAYGSKKNMYWAIARYGNKYAFECKIPVYSSSKGVHAGVQGGPLIKLSESNTSKRTHLSDMLINTVDVKTHRLVDTVEFPIKKNDL